MSATSATSATGKRPAPVEGPEASDSAEAPLAADATGKRQDVGATGEFTEEWLADGGATEVVPQGPPKVDMSDRSVMAMASMHDAEIQLAKRDPRFPDFLRQCKQDMGDFAFAEWLGFGKETPEADVKKFRDWLDKHKPERDGELHNIDDVHVVLQSAVVPLEGKEAMDVLVTVPGTDLSSKDGGMELGGKADLLVLCDQSGSMHDAVDLLQNAVIKMADDQEKIFSKNEQTVELGFAYGRFGSDADFPGIMGHKPGPTGYTPWQPLHETKVSMRNVAQTLDARMGGTNMKAALKEAIRAVGSRRDEAESLPRDHLFNILLMTDGNASDGNVVTIPQMLKEYITEESIVVHVLALGDGVDMELCEAIAGTTNGVVAHAATASALNDAFESILHTIRSSAKAFTLQIKDKGGSERIEHYGVLNKGNNQALTKLSFGPKTSDGCHIAATVGFMGKKKMPTAVMPLYALPDAAVWQSDRAKEPMALTNALVTERLMREHRKKVEAKAEADGYAAALELSSQLTQDYVASGMAPVALARVNAFHADLDRTITAQTHAASALGISGEEPSALGRSMTVSAVASRSSYSQAY